MPTTMTTLKAFGIKSIACKNRSSLTLSIVSALTSYIDSSKGLLIIRIMPTNAANTGRITRNLLLSLFASSSLPSPIVLPSITAVAFPAPLTNTKRICATAEAICTAATVDVPISPKATMYRDVPTDQAISLNNTGATLLKYSFTKPLFHPVSSPIPAAPISFFL